MVPLLDLATAARTLRARAGTVVSAWLLAIRDRAPALGQLSPSELRVEIDPLVAGLAGSIESGDVASLVPVIERHALHRFRRGLAPAVLVHEYECLRSCVKTALADAGGLDEVERAIDDALALAVDRYFGYRDELRERFTGMLAHDLRGPLSCVTMGSELLLRTLTATRERTLLSMIQDAADRMQRMVTDVLAMAREALDSDIPVNPRSADFALILAAALDEIRTVHGHAAIRADVHGDLHGDFDRDRVHQVLSNLLRNAIEHGAGTVSVAASESPDGRAVLLVVDNDRADPDDPDGGADGIDGAPVPRARHTSSIRFGMFIVERIAHAHGATIDVSQDAQRMTITVRWPKRHTRPDELRAPPDDEPMPVGG